MSATLPGRDRRVPGGTPLGVAAAGDLLAALDEAAAFVPSLWPLGTAVAVNPLWDLRHLGFAGAVERASVLLGISGCPDDRFFADAYREGRVTDADLADALRRRAARRHAGPDTPVPGSAVPGSVVPGSAGTAAARFDRMSGTEVAAATDREVAKWAAAYLGGVVPDPAPAGFYPTWKRVARPTRTLRRAGAARWPRHLPEGALDALGLALAELGIGEEDVVGELTAQLARLPGWAGHAKWRSKWAAPDHPGPPLHLVDYLAVRLSHDAAGIAAAPASGRPGNRRQGDAGAPPPRAARRRVLSGAAVRQGFGRPAAIGRRRSVPSPEAARARAPEPPGPGAVDPTLVARLANLAPAESAEVWLRAYESHYADRLLAAIDQPDQLRRTTRPAAQVVCCIDPRSEGLRRHLEAAGDYETFGFAGFFGIPARVRPPSGALLDLFPVLLRPGVEVVEEIPDPRDALRHAESVRSRAALEAAVVAGRETAVSAYLLAEAAGFALGPLAAARTLAPRAVAALGRRATRRESSRSRAQAVLDGPGAPADDVQADHVEAALRTMGLTSGFAPLVVLCGHGSTTTNNPYASALDCGACGAARGARSARLAAAMANRPAVRHLLAERGIEVPADTVFVAAEHDTATDTVTVFDDPAVPPGHLRLVEELRGDLGRAGVGLATERTRDLPGAARRAGPDHVATRSADWAQLQPEWGLARNAALLVAPRRRSAGVDLDRRCFLHSYEPDGDPGGEALEAILAGPGVVAQWISAHYYFSTVDPERLGAGDKAALNVVAGIGVTRGDGEDLCVGLPRQAVFDRDRPYHEPMRLLVAVDSPTERVEALLARNRVLAELADGEWMSLYARHHRRWWRREPAGAWHPWKPAGAARS